MNTSLAFNRQLEAGRRDLEAEPQMDIVSDDPMALAREIQRKNNGIVRWQDQFWRWSNGAYLPMSKDEVRTLGYKSLEAFGIEKITMPKVSNVIDALAAETFIDPMIEPPCLLSTGLSLDCELIAVSNGIVNINTGELQPSTPDLFTLSALPVEYDPEAGCQQWIKFLRTLWADDLETAGVLQELLGYLISCRTDQQKVFILIGPKRAGKGTILRIMTYLLGRHNVAAPTLNSLSTNFGLQTLIGKTAALISDARLSGRADQEAIAERLLSISGEDHINIPRKFMPDYTAKMNVRFVMATNEMPKLNDASGALASRFIPLVLSKSFFGNEDRGLTDRLMTELPGILNWAIEGYRRLMKRGYFLVPETAKDLLQEMHELGSPISAFIGDRCTIESGATVECKQLYKAWRDWCQRHGRSHPGTEQSFGRDLRAAVPGLTVTQPRSPDGGRVRIYNGIGLLHESNSFSC
jgi:putative DNA primase/helicase